MDAFFLHVAAGHEMLGGKRGTLVEVGENRALAQLPLPIGAVKLTGVSLAAIRVAQGITSTLTPPPAEQLRAQLAKFKGQLSVAQLAALWYPNREPIASALADAADGDARGLEVAKHIVRTLPFVDGRDDTIKAAALALVGE